MQRSCLEMKIMARNGKMSTWHGTQQSMTGSPTSGVLSYIYLLHDTFRCLKICTEIHFMELLLITKPILIRLPADMIWKPDMLMYNRCQTKSLFLPQTALSLLIQFSVTARMKNLTDSDEINISFFASDRLLIQFSVTARMRNLTDLSQPMSLLPTLASARISHQESLRFLFFVFLVFFVYVEMTTS